MTSDDEFADEWSIFDDEALNSLVPELSTSYSACHHTGLGFASKEKSSEAYLDPGASHSIPVLSLETVDSSLGLSGFAQMPLDQPPFIFVNDLRAGPPRERGKPENTTKRQPGRPKGSGKNQAQEPPSSKESKATKAVPKGSAGILAKTAELSNVVVTTQTVQTCHVIWLGIELDSGGLEN
ncbi:hypothetical protein ARMGADRAFT_1038056 [Armillaria gallica]|uniref:Uncharacterized protein n=1 Tax=Armillaria gallica TaxID=47427 RepID=A0A2H3D702_ARMGA|nr:hypothetical protein ARMGADRAFT_1038056 [Armillaria gallica]